MPEILRRIFSKYLHTYVGLLAGVILVLLTVVLPLDSFLEKGVPQFSFRLIIHAAIELSWLAFWVFYVSHLPKNSKNKVGVFLAINAESDKQRLRIKTDLADGIRRLLKENGLEETVNVIVLEDFRARKASAILDRYSSAKSNVGSQSDPKVRRYVNAFKRLRSRVRGHFFIWGSIKERQDIENKYFLHLNALVVHRPVDLHTSNALMSEMLLIFPKQIALAESLEFHGFQFAGNVLYIACLYISGIAAYVSADPFTAYKLHHVLLKEFRKFNPLPASLQRVQRNLLELIALELNQQARHAFYKKRDLRRSMDLLRMAERASPENYHVLIFLSLVEFERNRNPSTALSYLDRAEAKGGGDNTWMYNKAFLLAYSERFNEALSLYLRIENLNFTSEEHIVQQCVDYNLELLMLEPTKIQCHFILGFLYLVKQDDKTKATEQFQLFVRKAAQKKGKYSVLVDKAEEYLSRTL